MLLPGEHLRLDPLAQVLGQRERGLGIDIEGEQAEFISAQPRQHVAGTAPLAHGQRQLREQLVAGHVPGKIVDQLELVEIEVQQRTGQAPGPGLAFGQGLFHPALEFAPVAQFGQGVVGGLVAEAFGQLALLGNIGGHHQQVRFAFHLHLGDGGIHPERSAARSRQLRFHAVPAVADGVRIGNAVTQ